VETFDYRELTPADFDAAARLFTVVYPHRSGEPDAWLTPSPREAPVRWGIFESPSETCRLTAPESRLLAYAALWRVHGDKYRFDVIVDERHRRCGLGTHLLHSIVASATSRGAATLQARAYLASDAALGFLKRRGFGETMRMRGFVLDPARVDAASVRTWTAHASGVTIARVARAEAERPEFWRELHVLHEATREGWPDPDPGGEPDPFDLEDLRRMCWPPDEPPLAFFVARHDEQPVGYSVLRYRRSSREAQFAATGVAPAFRGRGIATALRAHCLTVATEDGCRAVRSASGNDFLIRINARFGFVETYCEVRLVRRLRSS
jgi:ribosomal protein S18 acetylase RimI-like enzyme